MNANRRDRQRLKLQTAHFRELAHQLQTCRAYLHQARRAGNDGQAAQDRKDELVWLATELQAMGAWACPLYYEGHPELGDT